MEWRVLVVDDEWADKTSELIEESQILDGDDVLKCTRCTNFDDAVSLLSESRFDLVVLDLQDGPKAAAADEGDALAGKRVYQRIQEIAFTPVLFFTAFAKEVEELQNPFVRVVSKGTNPAVLKGEIKAIFATKLPKLIRHIEESQRKYMWESMVSLWGKDINNDNSSDLVYLLARRLSNILRGDVVRQFISSDNGAALPNENKIHPIEYYVWPPVSGFNLFGDIFLREMDGVKKYFVVTTPTCDFAQCKADSVIFACCDYVSEQDQIIKYIEGTKKEGGASNTVKKAAETYLKGRALQEDRNFFLPGTSFLPDLMVDFQKLITVEAGRLGPDGYVRVASLDSPFAELLQSRLTRYYGRIGTPDLDLELSLMRLAKP